MKINGIGTIRKQDAMRILTREGREAVKAGEITIEELGDMYKLEMVKRSSKIGRNSDTFRESYKWIPEDLKEELAPEQLGKLVDSFYECYGAGKEAEEKMLGSFLEWYAETYPNAKKNIKNREKKSSGKD